MPTTELSYLCSICFYSRTSQLCHRMLHFEAQSLQWGKIFSIANERVRLSLYTSQVAHQAKAYAGFSSIMQLLVFLLPPE